MTPDVYERRRALLQRAAALERLADTYSENAKSASRQGCEPQAAYWSVTAADLRAEAAKLRELAEVAAGA